MSLAVKDEAAAEVAALESLAGVELEAAAEAEAYMTCTYIA